jgi:hypothetical protein
MKINVYVKLSTKSDSSGNPRRLYIVKEIDTEAPHFGGTRKAIISENYNGNQEVMERFPGTVEIGSYDVPYAEYKRWMDVKKSDDKINELAKKLDSN